MSSPDEERDALRRIEKGLKADDRAFAAKMSRRNGMDDPRIRIFLLFLSDATAVLMVLTGVLAGSPLLFFVGFVATCGLVWTHRFLRDKSRDSHHVNDPLSQ
ncbi:DUF3040 domain-containing protein [Amycolatopsis sp. cmx-11-51]|uniref:DUF3040 domain-containing protein n=1 Tax=unclassified Amycolatopsis TaxID=2618356 RepID=UPI0039E3D835